MDYMPLAFAVMTQSVSHEGERARELLHMPLSPHRNIFRTHPKPDCGEATSHGYIRFRIIAMLFVGWPKIYIYIYIMRRRW